MGLSSGLCMLIQFVPLWLDIFFPDIFVFAGSGLVGLKPHVFTVQAGEVHCPMLLFAPTDVLCTLRILSSLSIRRCVGFLYLHDLFVTFWYGQEWLILFPRRLFTRMNLIRPPKRLWILTNPCLPITHKPWLICCRPKQTPKPAQQLWKQTPRI